jgi:hypothetical protein
VLCRHDLPGNRALLRYSDGTRFYLDFERPAVWATWPETLTLDDTATYLLGPVLGYFLRRRGRVCLHASAVALHGGCVVFVGPAGAGKSTLAAAFAMRGDAVLAEDVTCLSEEAGAFEVQHGYPRIRLWQESAALIGAAPDSLPLLTPTWDKRYLPLGARFHDRPARLAAIFLLRPRRALEAPAEAAALDGRAILSELVSNTYATHLLDREQRAAEFAVLGRLARTVPMRALTLNADGSRLGEACDWIRRHALA